MIGAFGDVAIRIIGFIVILLSLAVLLFILDWKISRRRLDDE